MKPNHSSEDDCRLIALLCEWKVDAPLPPRFREGVWRKIGREEEPALSRWRPWWEYLVSRWAALLRQPVGAVAYLTILMAAGTGLGYWQAERFADRTEVAWRAAYVQSVNPYSARPAQ